MFAKLSLNEDKIKMKKRNEFSITNQKHQFEYGRPEWNQEKISTNLINHNIKIVIKNF
jgi:hypothetical protein